MRYHNFRCLIRREARVIPRCGLPRAVNDDSLDSIRAMVLVSFQSRTLEVGKSGMTAGGIAKPPRNEESGETVHRSVQGCHRHYLRAELHSDPRFRRFAIIYHAMLCGWYVALKRDFAVFWILRRATVSYFAAELRDLMRSCGTRCRKRAELAFSDIDSRHQTRSELPEI